MVILNSFKLLFSNFNNVWKTLLYKVTCLVVLCAISLPVISPIIDIFAKYNFFVILSDLLKNGVFAMNGAVIAQQEEQLLSAFNGATNVVLSTRVLNIVLLCIIIFVVAPYILPLCDLSIEEIIYGKMSSNTTYSFFDCFVRNFLKSCKLQLLLTAINVPFYIFVCFICYILSQFFLFGGIVALVTPTLLLLVIILLFSLKSAFFAVIRPAITINDYSTFKAFKIGVSHLKSKFGTIFSNILVINVIHTAIVLFVFAFTLGVGLIIILPCISVLNNIIYLVIAFNILGMNYYIDDEEVVYTKKLENDADIEKLKFLI
jgi:hypothetical protein